MNVKGGGVLPAVAVLALGVAVAAGLGMLLVWSAGAFGTRGPTFAFLLAWLPGVWLVIVGAVKPIRLPARWYELRAFERDGRVYERLGVRVAKRLLRRGPLSVFSRSMRLPRHPTLDDLRELDRRMHDAETGHTISFAAVLAAAVVVAVPGWWDTLAWLLLFDVLVNAYPVMLQRYNRGPLTERMRLAGSSRRLGA